MTKPDVSPPVGVSPERIAEIRARHKRTRFKTERAIRDLLAALDAVTAERDEARRVWRCFHCEEVFADEREAREHFGSDEYKMPACCLSSDDVKQLRALEADNAALHRENERLDNDARLWHESEADRVRRIGNVQWWQELDYREGEKIALTERVAAAEAECARLRERASTLEDAAFHFQTCVTCCEDGEESCASGRVFAAFLRGEDISGN